MNTRYTSHHSGGVSHSGLNKTSECHLWGRSNAGTAMKYVVGQRVQAQYRVGSTWRSAIVHSVHPSSLSVQFDGWEDVNYIPIERARHDCEEDQTSNQTSNSTLKAFVSRGSAVLSKSPRSRVRRGKATSKLTSKPMTSKPTTSKRTTNKLTSTPTKVKSDAIRHLQVLKQTAVLNEDFLTAANLKMQIEKVAVMEREKVAAVSKENYLLAMDIKKQIDKLLEPYHERLAQCK